MKTDKRKKAKIVIVSILVLLLILSSVFLVLKLLSPKVDFTTKRDDIFYFPVDYNENAFDDIVYMSKNRDVKFDYYGMAVYINDDNVKEQSTDAKFFYDYIQTVINGDAEKHKTFFTKSFFSHHSIPQKFTMQKIYDVEISAMTSDVKDGFSYETYKVSYKIQENNGTFRADVSSNESKPIAITIQKGKELKISAIVPIL